MKCKFLFFWWDLWVGFFWDKEAHWLYFLFLPTIGIVIKFKPKTYNIGKIGPDFFIVEYGQPLSSPCKTERQAYIKAWNRYNIDNSR